MDAAQTEHTISIGPRPGDPLPELAPGDTLGRYAILERLGTGGMGRVYRAYDPKLRREVALKQLKALADPRAQSRFVREAQAMAKLSHPNVLPVFDVDTEDRQVFIAMEYVDGDTLDTFIAKNQGDWRAILSTFVHAGEGLAAAHREGLIHRDFKPTNVLVGRDGRVRVLDFGLVQLSDDADIAPPSNPQDEGIGALGSAPELTRIGTVMGTPMYMSPEQHTMGAIDARSDQYAFCVALFEGLYGKRPFPAGDYLSLANAKRHAEIREVAPPSGLPRSVRLAVRRGLSPKARDRYENMDGLLAALRGALAGRRRRATALGAAALAGVTGFAVAHGDDRPMPCQAAAQELEPVWNDDVRTRLHGVFVESGAVTADAMWARASVSIDTWADRWRSEHREACLATQVRAVQSEERLDLRMRCLERRRLAVAALFEGWREGLSPRSLGAATSAAASLPDPTRCADPEFLRASIPPPDDPAVAEEVLALRNRIATADGWILAAKYERAAQEVEQVHARAGILGYRPLLASSHLALGKLRSELGDHAAATHHSRSAYFDAIASGDDGVAAESSVLLVSYLGRDLHEPDAAQRWRDNAEAWVDRTGDTGYRARLHEAVGGNLLAASDYAGALEEYTRSFELRKRNPDGPLVLALSHNNVGVALMRLGRYAEAVEHYRAAQAIVRETLGEDHPDIAISATNLGNALERQGEYDAAEASLRQALQVFERVLGEEHPNIAIVLTNLGNVLTSKAEHERARPVFERALAVSEVAFGPKHPVTAAGHNNIGENLHSRGRLQEARAAHERGLALRIEILGERSPDVAVSRANLGEVLEDLGELEAARDELEAALGIRAEAKLDPRLLADNELQLARVLWHGELDPARARSLAASARGRYESSEASGPGLDNARALLAEIGASGESDQPQPAKAGESH